MKKTSNKYINIESYNTINNSSTGKRFITVNRLHSKFDNNKTIIIQRRKNIIPELNTEFKTFIYKKKSKLEKSNSFCIQNKKNLSLRNDISLFKEDTPLLLIPSYKHYDFKKNSKNLSNKKNNKNKKQLQKKCKLYISRNNKNKSNNKDLNKRNTFNLKNEYTKNKNKGISNNSTGISLGGDISNKNKNNNLNKYNCYSYDDDTLVKDEQNSNSYYNDVSDDFSILFNKNKNENNSKNKKYIQIIEKENELLKNELKKTNKKLNLLEKKIENLIEGKFVKNNTQTILTNARANLPTYKKNNIIKKCPVPTPYVQKFSKNDFFSFKNKDIKVTLKLKNHIHNEESKNNY